MYKEMALSVALLSLNGCSDSHEMVSNLSKDGMTIVKSFKHGLSLVKDDRDILYFSYGKNKSRSDQFCYFDWAYHNSLNEDFTLYAENINDLVDIETLELDFYEGGLDGHNIYVVGFKDKDYFYHYAFSTLSSSCEENYMYYDTEADE